MNIVINWWRISRMGRLWRVISPSPIRKVYERLFTLIDCSGYDKSLRPLLNREKIIDFEFRRLLKLRELQGFRVPKWRRRMRLRRRQWKRRWIRKVRNGKKIEERRVFVDNYRPHRMSAEERKKIWDAIDDEEIPVDWEVPEEQVWRRGSAM